ncbi:DEAD/DEAH box helicase family protein [Flavobacterium oreochromis]|uniref:DEAD/DEAH box helicase family protein n=1 Tax=Flavobacterium oreochromis TaxID=2906078 RepID=UPI0013F665F0
MSTIDFDLVNVPVEYKKINVEDFDSNYYNSTKEFISPNPETGYISEELMPILIRDLDVKNTTVINAGTGQGKSKCIIDLVQEYKNKSEYIIVFALPFNSLIQQYYNQCKDFIEEKKIFSLLDIDENELLADFNYTNLFGAVDDEKVINQSKPLNYKIHILTVNAFLRNPGDDYVFQAGRRKRYFDKLHRYCEENNKKLILIFDEVHDSIKNFKEEYIYNLWNFKNIIYKSYVVSATFNEASKEVIKYLSEFTNKSINIIESERIIIPNKQGNLHLIINQSKKSFLKNEILNDVIRQTIQEDKSLDIIVYAKSQVEYLENNKYLEEISSGNYNYCYSVGFSSKNYKKYIDGRINVGTNFYTGINIEDDNHTLILVLPKRINQNNDSSKGIFSNGINSFLQAIARQRNKGDIYIIISEPFGLNSKSLPFDNEVKNQIIKIFDEYRNFKSINYSDINSQSFLLDKTYKRLIDNVKKAKENIDNSDRMGMNTLSYPSKEQFILSKGEKFLTSKYFDGDLSTIVFYLAITNQFSNCKLTSIYYNKSIQFTSENLDLEIAVSFNDFILQDAIDDIENLFYYPDGDGFYEYGMHPKISVYSGISIFKNLMDFLNSRSILIDGVKADDKTVKYIKFRYLAQLLGLTSDVNEQNLGDMYFKSCLGQVINQKSSISEISFSNEQLNFYFNHYNKWLIFIEILNNSIFQINNRNLIEKSPNENFKRAFILHNMFEELKELIKIDEIIKLNLFPFYDTFKRKSNESEAVTFYYKQLLKIFFSISDFQSSDGRRYYKVDKLFSQESFGKDFFTNIIFSNSDLLENDFPNNTFSH